MVRQAVVYDARFLDYVSRVSLRQPELYERLRAETAKHPRASMMLAPEQGQFLALVTRLMGARQAIEVGTFTGYSSLWLADALPDDGRLVCCEIDREYAAIARRYWREAGLEERIDLCLAPALETLDGLLAEEGEGAFDLVFIDADKPNYRAYYERGISLVRSGGLVVIDNVFWGGEVADPAIDDPTVCILRDLNAFIHQDARVDISMVPLGDGLTLARKL